MITSNDLRNGMHIVFEGEVYTVVEFEHVKSANRRAIVRVRLKNMNTGTIVEHKYQGKEAVEQATLDKRELHYLYRDKNLYYFMDNDTSEQMSVDVEKIKHLLDYLKEDGIVNFTFYEGEAVDIGLPDFIELKVTHALPGVKGDTVQGGSKPVTLETGKELQVPLFINEGDVVRIDTRINRYIERVQK
jgi:elongation factor P